MGVVYKARDRGTGQVVALKEMRQTSPEALYRFKREFRSRAELAHDNLVRLYEMFAEADQWFFTMELIEGSDFLSYVCHGHERLAGADTRPTAGGAAVGRLRGALRQLAAGVAAIHVAGLLHRDLKPGNVLVTAAGRVVVLDFGLVANLEQSASLNSGEGQLLGTVAYMAPEQAAGHALSAAADWYSVGVILYEALTGRLPFAGTTYEILHAKQQGEPAPPRELVPGVPDDLNSLCVQLLSRRPGDRPTGEQIFRSCQVPSAAAAVPPARRMEADLVGRDSHLAALAEAFADVRQGKTVAVFVAGESGAGKSALARRFVNSLREAGEAVVLEGQCFEQESVPYKAFDGVIDMLSRLLARMPPTERDAVLPREVGSLLRVFPVLRRAIRLRRGADIPDPQEVRRRAFTGLRELLARLGDRRPLALFIDDLQWGDAESAALLAELLQPPDPPAFLLLGCYRSEEVATGRFVAKLADLRQRTHSVVQWRGAAVDPLTLEQASELAALLLDDAPPPNAANTIARESGGNPFFVHELAQAARNGADQSADGVSLERVLWRRIQRLPPAARDLLSVVALAVRPIGREDACRSTASDADALVSLAELRAQRLVRGTGAVGEDVLSPYHDRVRETLSTHLTPDEMRDVHRRFARTLEAAGRADPEALAVHFQGAGEMQRAGHYFALAADAAAEALAFDRAARLYRLGLELRPDSGEEDGRLRLKLADTLANAGRGRDAAEAYLRAVEGADPAEAMDLQRRGALQYMISGHTDLGMKIFKAVLHARGMNLPRTAKAALFTMLFRRFLLRIRGLSFRRRTADEVSPKDLANIDICWSATTGFGMVDTIQGISFQTLGLLLALRAGEPYRIARGLAFEAAFVTMGGSRYIAKGSGLLAHSKRIAREIKDPNVNGNIILCEGVLEYFVGNWAACKKCCDEAEAVF